MNTKTRETKVKDLREAIQDGKTAANTARLYGLELGSDNTDVGVDDCVICGKAHKGFGNTAEPIVTGEWCCPDCFESIVVPFRNMFTFSGTANSWLG